MILNRSFSFTFLSTFSFFASFYILLPVMPRYVVFLGGKEAAVGLVMGFFTISAVTARLLFGKYVDNHGCKKTMVAGASVFFLSGLLYIFSGSIEALYLIRIFHGLGIASFTVGAITLVSQTTPTESRGEALGLYTISTIIAMALFPWTGDFLVRYSFSCVFGASALLALSSLIFCLFVSDYVGKKEDGIILSRFLLIPALTIFCVTFSYGAIVSFLPLVSGKAGLFYFLYACTVILSRLTFLRLSDRFGRKKIINPAMVATFLGVLMLARGGEFYVSLSAIVYGVGFGTVYPTLNALVVDKIKRRGEALSIFSASFDGGIACGSIILGAVAEEVGFSFMFLVAAAIVFVGFLLFFFSARRWTEDKL